MLCQVPGVASLALGATLLSCFCFIVSFAEDADRIEKIFFVKPGAGKLSVQTEVKKYQCKFTYAAQGGTHEEWQMGMELVDNGAAVICSVERAGSSSYLYFENFSLDLTGPMVAITEVDMKDSQRDNRDLSPEEYSKEKTSVSSIQGKFKNHLEKAAVYSQLSRDDL